MVKRKHYTKEYKMDAVSLVMNQGYKRSEAARNLGINAQMLGVGQKNHKRKMASHFGGMAS